VRLKDNMPDHAAAEVVPVIASAAEAVVLR
jgi:hypothetical protein